MRFLKIRPFLLVCVFWGYCTLFIPALSYGQNRSLNYFLKQAYNNDPQLSTYQRNAKIAGIGKQINESMFRKPVLSGDGYALWAPGTSTWGFDKAITNGGEYDALLSLTYPLWQGNSLKAHNSVSNSQVKQADYKLRYRKHNLRMMVTSAYIQVYGDQQNLQYLEELHQLLQKQIGQLTSLVQNGLIKVTDLQQVRLEDAQIRIQQKQARNQWMQDRSSINQLCGLSDTTLYSVTDPGLKIPETKNLNRIQHSRFLRSYRIDSLSVEAQQKVRDTRYLPKLNAMANTGVSASNLSNAYHNFGLTVGLQLRWRLWDGGQKSLQHQKTELNLANLQDQKRFEKLRLFQKRNTLEKSLRDLRGQITDQEKQVSDYKNLLNAYRTEIDKGIQSVTSYVTVFRQYLSARNKLNSLKIQRLHTINKLDYWNW